MGLDYNNIVRETLKKARDIMRADNNLISTILSIPGGTSSAHNYVFAGRPVDQKKGFDNPRIVCEASIYEPKFLGNNPNGLSDDNINFQISAWTDESDGFSKSFDVNARIKTLLDGTDFSVSAGTDLGSNGSFKVISTDSVLDPDKNNTMQSRIIVSASFIISKN